MNVVSVFTQVLRCISSSNC